MATPMLSAVRKLYPDAKITGLVKANARPVLDGCPWVDRWITLRPKKGKSTVESRKLRFVTIARRLRRRRFDLAIILPNSFRSALLARRAKITRRLGYERDSRSLLLTDRILPMKENGKYKPVSAVQYYMGLARYLGAEELCDEMQLFTRAKHDELVKGLFEDLNLGIRGNRKQPVVILNPGAANHGDAKIWPADRFGKLADELIEHYGAKVLISGAPNEKLILNTVQQSAKHPLVNLSDHRIDLSTLKSVIKQCDLMVSNDTGPRHMAVALNTPVVSLFGPTDPRWAISHAAHERVLRCTDGPRANTMLGIEVEGVVKSCEELLNRFPILS